MMFVRLYRLDISVSGKRFDSEILTTHLKCNTALDGLLTLIMSINKVRLTLHFTALNNVTYFTLQYGSMVVCMFLWLVPVCLFVSSCQIFSGP